ncbi:hypothetical protein DHEL01_v204717 [Diaporthe helianthi]|uniref:Uncharacterized protein n=1 Tax=Diaporthe helianthi TaxID=158607 RepID=A0A2P5I313_DIAHE|nr:hypothetical protein DHEL01_v204717 [Diaporthe helianthi]
MPNLAEALELTFRMASEITRFIIKPPGPKYYQEQVNIFQNLLEIARVPMDEDVLISLFAIGVHGYITAP